MAPGRRADTRNMPIRLASLTLFLVLVAVSPVRAQFAAVPSTSPTESYVFEIGLMYWKPTPELVITSPSLDPTGNPIDFVTDWSLENDRFREIRATLKPGYKHKIRFAYLPVKYEETALVTRTLRLNGSTVTGSLDITMNLEWDLWRFGYEYDVVSNQYGFVGVIGDVTYNKVNAGLSAAPGEASIESTAPVPTFGGIARGYLAEGLSATVELTGLSLDRDDYRGKIFDFDVYGTLNLGANLAVQGGYRSLTVEYLADGDEGDFTLKGPYIGGLVRF